MSTKYGQKSLQFFFVRKLNIIVYYFSLFQPWRKKAFLPSAKSKDNLLFGILNPLRPLFFFDHHPHSYTVGEKNSPSPSPCDYAVRGFALRIICNLKLVKIWKNTTKAINEISLYNLDWFDNRVDYKPKLKFLYILAENHQRHVLTKFH